MCLRSLEEEIMFNAGHLLAVEEPPREKEEDQPEASQARLKKKPGRAFRHALSLLYIRESGKLSSRTTDPVVVRLLHPVRGQECHHVHLVSPVRRVCVCEIIIIGMPFFELWPKRFFVRSH